MLFGKSPQWISRPDQSVPNMALIVFLETAWYHARQAISAERHCEHPDSWKQVTSACRSLNAILFQDNAGPHFGKVKKNKVNKLD